MATPSVSAAAAILLQQNPNLSPDTVKARLMQSASKTFPTSSSVTDGGHTYYDVYDVFTVGAGYLDINAALQDKNNASGSALSPSLVWQSSQNSAYMVLNSSPIWQPGLGHRVSVWGTKTMVNGTFLSGGMGVTARRCG